MHISLGNGKVLLVEKGRIESRESTAMKVPCGMWKLHDAGSIQLHKKMRALLPQGTLKLRNFK